MNATISVALFTDADVFAGTEKHLLDLALALGQAAPDISLVLVCPDPSPLAQRAKEAGLPVIAVASGASGVLDRRTLRVLRRHLRSGRIQILHAHNGRTALLAALAVALARCGRVVVTQHFLEPAHTAHHGFKAKLYAAAHRWVNARVAHFIAISQAARSRMLARGDASPERVSMIHNALFPPEASTLAPPATVRAHFGVPSSTPLLVCVARLEKEKSLDTLLEALHLLKAKRVAVHCIMAGEGGERAALETQAKTLGLGDRLQLPGYCTDVMSLIGAADVFVLPSRIESFGLVLLEAMALSKAVIATRAGGPAEVVADGESGVLVPPRDAAALAAALEKLVGDATLRTQMGRAGRMRYETHFQPQRMAQETADVYRRVLAAPDAL
jgi:glycosyltransferase involved in cell wall biosynthesis